MSRGSSLPETVIVMTILLALLFGIIDFGRALYTYSFVAQLAREGARWAIVRGSNCSLLTSCGFTDSQLQTYVQSLNEGATTGSQITASSHWTSSACQNTHSPGCAVTVTVSYPFTFFLPFVQQGTQMTFSSSSTMIMSN